jgi:hypothetical protein
MAIRVLFQDDYDGELPQDMGVEFTTAEQAQDWSQKSWADTNAEGGYVADVELTWDGAVGTGEYKMSMGPGSAVQTLETRYVIYKA